MDLFPAIRVVQKYTINIERILACYNDKDKIKTMAMLTITWMEYRWVTVVWFETKLSDLLSGL